VATITREFKKPLDTRAIAGPALDQALDDVLRGVAPLMMRLMKRPLEHAVGAVRDLIPSLDAHLRRDPYVALIAAAMRSYDSTENRIQEIESHLGIQEAALRFATVQEDREELYLATCQFLRRTPSQLRGDRRAMKRWMDWEAVLEIARRAQAEARRHQQTLVFLASRSLARCGPERGRTAAEVMERTGFAAAFHRAMQSRMPVHLEREWVDAVVAVLGAHRNLKKGVPVDPAILHALAVRGQDARADVWVQCSSLYAWLLSAPADALRLVRQRLKAPDTRIRNDMFVRRFLVEKAREVLEEMQALDLVQVTLALPDPSPHVRQGAILALADAEPDKAWPILREHVLMKEEWEPVPEVRATASLAIGRWASHPRGGEIALQEWRLLFEREEDPMALRVAIRHAGKALESLVGYRHLDARVCEQFALELLEKGATKPWPIPVRVALEDMLERIRVAALPEFPAFRDAVVPVVMERNREDQVDLFADAPIHEDVLGRLLAWLSRRHYGLYARPRPPGFRVSVGHQRRFRWWRFLHETFNPAPDKRQAHSHIRARRYEGILRAHALGLGEESPTKVPGEPVQMMAEGGWRRFLPLVDDFLDSLEFGPVKVYSSEGIASIQPPTGRGALWKLRWRMARRYPELAALREQSRYGNAEVPPNAYVETMRAMGFAVTFTPHPPPEHSFALPYFSPPASPAEVAAEPEAAYDWGVGGTSGAAPEGIVESGSESYVGFGRGVAPPAERAPSYDQGTPPAPEPSAEFVLPPAPEPPPDPGPDIAPPPAPDPHASDDGDIALPPAGDEPR
jgi:hypothetical protein